MPRKTTKRNFLKAVGAGAVTALAGCTGGDGDEGGDSSGGTLELASGSIQTVDPVSGKGGGAGAQIDDQIFEALVKFENGELGPVSQLAKSWETSNGAKTYRFELKEGVTFHDGQELTAEDFVYSWRRLAESDNSRNADDVIEGTFTIAHETETVTEDGEETEVIVPDSLAVRAVDDHTFEFDQAQAFHGALSQIAGSAFAVVPSGSVGDIEGHDGDMDYEEFSSGGAVGTGPFRIDTWTTGSEFVASKYEEYHGEVAKLDSIRWTILDDPNTRFTRAENENLDIFKVPTAQFSRDKRSIDEERDGSKVRIGEYGPLGNGETVNYGEVTSLDTSYLLFNTERTSERAARRAIAYLLNQHRIVEESLKGVGYPAYHITPRPVYPGGPEAYDQHAQENYPYGYDEQQISKATQVMEEAGYGESNKYSIELTIRNDSTAWEEIANLIRDKGDAAHLDVSVTTASFETIISRAIDGSMDVFSLSDGLEWPESDNFLRFLHPSTSSSFTRWGQFEGGKSEFTQKAEEAWQTYLEHRGPGDQNQQARNDAYVTIEEMNWQGVAELPLFHRIQQRFWYDWVDVEMHGVMTDQQYNRVTKDK